MKTVEFANSIDCDGVKKIIFLFNFADLNLVVCFFFCAFRVYSRYLDA